ncbi:ubiquitin-protein ligase [Lithospermum erythrorhizon]|uniref:E3 ubiquitin-protein ligase RMA n=1 Tax=Lithospermum erythrorhizon TaxID=34254 RepID=A0AAV3PAW8_LITER
MDCGLSDVVRAMTPEADVKCDAGNFECNICFELAQDPIVTLCGHLYCWSCLYQWLQVHSHSHECPVCKALVQEEKLVPIYGRGKSSVDPRPQLIPEVNIPNRPIGQRPQTAPPVDINYFRQNELDHTAGYSPMAAARFGNLTLSALFGAIPAFFNLQVHGFHDATVYGATTGVPYMFSSSFHGGYVHGLNHSPQVEGTRFLLKMLFLILGFVLIMLLLC